MKVKVSEASGPVLDWMVAKCQKVEVELGTRHSLWKVDADVFGNRRVLQGDEGTIYHPSQDWSLGGPILDRKKIGTIYQGGQWIGSLMADDADPDNWDWKLNRTGPTKLIAGLRCYVVSELGEEVDVPEELLS